MNICIKYNGQPKQIWWKTPIPRAKELENWIVTNIMAHSFIAESIIQAKLNATLFFFLSSRNSAWGMSSLFMAPVSLNQASSPSSTISLKTSKQTAASNPGSCDKHLYLNKKQSSDQIRAPIFIHSIGQNRSAWFCQMDVWSKIRIHALTTMLAMPVMSVCQQHE